MSSSVTLGHRFADELPELALPWQAGRIVNPRLLVLNEPLAEALGLDPGWLRGEHGRRFLTGNRLPEDARPVAQAYAGHQFGSYSPRLGDGRALLLGELTDADGALVDVHLKGSGRTPFARGGDGLAAIGPMLREFVVGEAMHALGVPTTRALAVLATGTEVYRETDLPGAVLVRIARSHLRVGSFQYARATGNLDLLRRLADQAIARHHPDLASAAEPYSGLYEAVVAAQAELVARWMTVGFVHGVMNTDNMTISGQTIDYGPCAFLDAYDPETVYSSIDTGGRYAYGNQPAAAQWNLARLAEAMLPLFAPDQDRAIALATESLDRLGPLYQAAWTSTMRAKLGLAPDVPDRVALPLAADLLAQLQQSGVDFTSLFRDLARAARGDVEPARDRFLDITAWDAWTDRWLALRPDATAMDRVNPVYIPRNHLVEEALGAATDGDLAAFDALLDAVRAPFAERPGLERYADPAPGDFGPYQTFCGT